MPQIVLNLLLSVFYVAAVVATPPLNPNDLILAGVPGRGGPGVHGTNQINRVASAATNTNRTPRVSVPVNSASDNPADEVVPGELLLRASVLWMLALCCYGAQVLTERQREAMQEAAEFAAREGQLHSAGRLAAEFAHQIKNPLAVINNAAYSLKRTLGKNNNPAAQQIEIIQEEVARADKVITQIMGYAQLSEGRVEKLKVIEEVERAGEQVFPAAVPTGIRFKKKFIGPFHPLLMQRGHFADIVINLLLNAREALNGQGTVLLTAACHRDQAVEITVADDGPGIAPDKIGRVFEAYFTTKEKGTGLGLAIVKHNAELYGGSVRVETELGKGAKFTVSLPSKLQPKPFVK
jgi:signal transduction histidine kinase